MPVKEGASAARAPRLGEGDDLELFLEGQRASHGGNLKQGRSELDQIYTILERYF